MYGDEPCIVSPKLGIIWL